MLNITPLFKIILITFLPILAISCDTLFDKGHTERVFEGEVLEFFPLNAEAVEGSGSTNVAIQLIGEQRNSALSVVFSVNSESSTAEEGVHYEIEDSSPVTLAANSSSANITINVLANSLAAGEVAVLVLELQGAPDQGMEAGENINTYTLIITAEEDQ